MKTSLTLSTLILSFVIHAAITGRLHSASKMILAECYVDEKPVNCKLDEYTMVNTSDDNKWCCLKFVYENDTKAAGSSSHGDSESSKRNSSTISGDKASEFQMFSTQNEQISKGSASSESYVMNSFSAKIKRRKVLKEIPIVSESSTDAREVLSSSETSVIPIPSAASESLSFNLENFHNDVDANTESQESSRILSVLHSSSSVPLTSASGDIINLTTLAALTETRETATVEESSATSTMTNEIAAEPSSSSLSTSTRRKLPARKQSRRARINKTPSVVVSESSSRSSSPVDSATPNEINLHRSSNTLPAHEKSSNILGIENQTGSGADAKENHISSGSVEGAKFANDSSDTLIEAESPHISIGNSDNQVDDETEKISSKVSEKFHLMSNSDESSLKVVDETVESSSADIQTSQKVSASQDAARGGSYDVTVITSQDDALRSSTKLETMETSLKRLREIAPRSDVLGASESSELQTAAKELIARTPSPPGKLPETAEPSSEDEKLSSAAETVEPSIQTFRTGRSFPTSGQDSSGALRETSKGFEAILKEIPEDDDEAGGDDDEALDDNAVAHFLLKPKLRHRTVSKAFNINEFPALNSDMDPFQPNKEKAPFPESQFEA